MKETKITRDEIVDAIRKINAFEIGKLAVKDYFNFINTTRIGIPKVTPCSGCPNLTRRVHSDFQIWVWRTALADYPELIPEIPQFHSYKYKSEFYMEQLKVLSVKKIQEHMAAVRTTIASNRANVTLATELQKDLTALDEYRKAKMGYFLPGGHWDKLVASEQAKSNIVEVVIDETQTDSGDEPKERKGGRQSKIDSEALLKMKDEGKTNVECAEFFSVSKSAISQTLKQLGYERNKRNEVDYAKEDSEEV